MSINLLYHTSTDNKENINRDVTCDFQQCGILTSVDSDEPVQPHFLAEKL